MTWKLWLDDDAYNDYCPNRQAPDSSWKVAESYAEAVSMVNHYGLPSFIDFDHDLGEGKTGFDFAKFIVYCDLHSDKSLPSDFAFNVHSANPVGAENIRSYLNNYLQVKQLGRG